MTTICASYFQDYNLMKTIPMYVYLVYSTYDYNGKNMF